MSLWDDLMGLAGRGGEWAMANPLPVATVGTAGIADLLHSLSAQRDYRRRNDLMQRYLNPQAGIQAAYQAPSAAAIEHINRGIGAYNAQHGVADGGASSFAASNAWAADEAARQREAANNYYASLSGATAALPPVMGKAGNLGNAMMQLAIWNAINQRKGAQPVAGQAGPNWVMQGAGGGYLPSGPSGANSPLMMFGSGTQGTPMPDLNGFDLSSLFGGVE